MRQAYNYWQDQPGSWRVCAYVNKTPRPAGPAAKRRRAPAFPSRDPPRIRSFQRGAVRRKRRRGLGPEGERGKRGGRQPRGQSRTTETASVDTDRARRGSPPRKGDRVALGVCPPVRGRPVCRERAPCPPPSVGRYGALLPTRALRRSEARARRSGREARSDATAAAHPSRGLGRELASPRRPGWVAVVVV